MNKVLFEKASLEGLEINPFTLMSHDWFLLTAGTIKEYNAMTASWGLMGYLWNKNIITTYIRPQRHTYEIAKSNNVFTLSFFTDEYRDLLTFCGKNSGRAVDKIKETGLIPIELDGGVSFEQAKIVFVCNKIYEDNIKESGFLNLDIKNKNYPQNDYHSCFAGEIISLYNKV